MILDRAAARRSRSTAPDAGPWYLPCFALCGSLLGPPRARTRQRKRRRLDADSGAARHPRNARRRRSASPAAPERRRTATYALDPVSSGHAIPRAQPDHDRRTGGDRLTCLLNLACSAAIRCAIGATRRRPGAWASRSSATSSRSTPRRHYSGLGGFLSLAYFTTTSVAGHSTDNLRAITAVAIGGTSLFGGVATIIGSVIGVWIPAVLQNGFVIIGVQPYWQDVAVGFVLILAVWPISCAGSRGAAADRHVALHRGRVVAYPARMLDLRYDPVSRSGYVRLRQGKRRADARALADGQRRVRLARPARRDPDHRARRDRRRVPAHGRRGDAAARHPRAGRPSQGGQPAAARRRARAGASRAVSARLYRLAGA